MKISCLLLSFALLCSATAAHGQVSLSTVVNLALKNSPKVRAAKADLDKAKANKSEVRDAYIPVVTTTSGYGQSTGAPLNVPTIFSINAQSLLFSFSQKDYIRSASEGIRAAEFVLHNAEIEVVEDTTNTYLALDFAMQRRTVLLQSLDVADRLVSVTSDRITLGVDPKVEAPKTRRTATQIRLQALQVDDDIASNRLHLAQLTGLPETSLITDINSVPAYHLHPGASTTDTASLQDSDGVRAAYASAHARQYTAFGDSRYLLRPQISLAANYSRVAIGLADYAAYYPKFGSPGNSENSMSYGLQFNIPLLDMAHRAKARASAADAARAYADADMQRSVYREGRAKLQNAARELDLRAQLARDDREIAQDQLETLQLQLNQQGGNSQGPQVTPKDQLNAQLQERQKYLDVLSADLQLRQTQVNVMRQTNTLGDWILGAVGGTSTLTPSIPPAAGNKTPDVSGTQPSGASTTPLPQAPGR
ncbi:TolC family protein [Terriglobus sp. RCC_193]|uniref:TolC family protein n=1 Tax=Terriglobus sp. RCC_193 TaxID=3239218 RepID=UPI00352313F8